MIPVAKTLNGLLQLASQNELYHALIQQLLKDFNLASLKIGIGPDNSPEEIKSILSRTLEILLESNDPKLVQLLYVLDIPEDTLSRTMELSESMVLEQLSFVILRRVWQKVWYRKFYE